MTLEQAALIATIGLQIQALVLLLIVLVAGYFVAWKGPNYLIDRITAGFGFVRRAAHRVEGIVQRAGYAAVTPLVWVYARTAWMRGFARSARQYRR